MYMLECIYSSKIKKVQVFTSWYGKRWRVTDSRCVGVVVRCTPVSHRVHELSGLGICTSVELGRSEKGGCILLVLSVGSPLDREGIGTDWTL